MAYLDAYTTPLTEQTAAHLLRRTTFGPTQQEITNFTGITADSAVNQLISNCNYNPPEPVVLNQAGSDRGTLFVYTYIDLSRSFLFDKYEKQWWIGLMANQASPPSILEKLTLFWQNHFVVNTEIVNQYKFTFKYLKMCRDYALGNFRTFILEMSKDPSMLTYLNGNENVVGAPNENYARELQELFTVGAKNFAGQPNYTENDIKEAARVLTGWKDFRQEVYNAYSVYDETKHDSGNKSFSSYYNNTTITGRGGSTGGNAELIDLVNMLLNHPETPKFICRKLYRWFVHTNVTQDIETNVIIPLANILVSNNYQISSVINKLLKSQHFYDISNIGSMIKSPCEFMIGAFRFFNFSVPPVNTTDVDSFSKYSDFLKSRLENMQMALIGQPSVFGYEPYYQTGLSRVWINSTSLAQRGSFSDTIVDGTYSVNSNYALKINLLSMAQEAMTSAPYDPFLITERFTKNLFATDLNLTQKNFLTDTILMGGMSRANWNFYWAAYIADPTNSTKQAEVIPRLTNLMKYLLRMAEYQLL